MLLRTAIAVSVLLAAPSAADAQAVASATADYGGLLNIVLMACATPVAAILSGALWKLWTWLGFKATAQDKANMEVELAAALKFGVAKALPAIEAKGWTSVDAHGAVLTQAAGYFLQRFPDRAATITAASGTTVAIGAVMDTLAARLPEALAVAAISPAAPPRAAPIATPSSA